MSETIASDIRITADRGVASRSGLPMNPGLSDPCNLRGVWRESSPSDELAEVDCGCGKLVARHLRFINPRAKLSIAVHK